MIEPISLTGMAPLQEITPLPLGQPVAEPGFMQAVEQGAGALNASLNQAESATRALAAGQDVPCLLYTSDAADEATIV